jgi:regulator of replication initiation timing
MSDYPYPDNPGQTHHEGCWRERDHTNCAIREVERLQEENKSLRKSHFEQEIEKLKLPEEALQMRVDMALLMGAVMEAQWAEGGHVCPWCRSYRVDETSRHMERCPVTLVKSLQPGVQDHA